MTFKTWREKRPLPALKTYLKGLLMMIALYMSRSRIVFILVFWIP